MDCLYIPKFLKYDSVVKCEIIGIFTNEKDACVHLYLYLVESRLLFNITETYEGETNELVIEYLDNLHNIDYLIEICKEQSDTYEKTWRIEMDMKYLDIPIPCKLSR